MKFTLVSAVNNEAVLESCLYQSPCLARAKSVLLQRGFTSAAMAYNQALDQAPTDIVVFVHQDMYFPSTWEADLERAIREISRHDPHWAVAGIWGVQRSGAGVGYLYCAGLARVLGEYFPEPIPVRTLDETVLILRKSSGLRFDEKIPGYHLYGTDLCLQAEQAGLKSYALAAFCIHNTNGYDLLPRQFWECFFLLRRKWKQVLPITTPCTEITYWCAAMLWWNLNRRVNLALGRHQAGKRVADPVQLYRELVVRDRSLGGPKSALEDLAGEREPSLD